jgi:hypothetical protein
MGRIQEASHPGRSAARIDVRAGVGSINGRGTPPFISTTDDWDVAENNDDDVDESALLLKSRRGTDKDGWDLQDSSSALLDPTSVAALDATENSTNSGDSHSNLSRLSMATVNLVNDVVSAGIVASPFYFGEGRRSPRSVTLLCLLLCGQREIRTPSEYSERFSITWLLVVLFKLRHLFWNRALLRPVVVA